jgi:hypothetical protein
MARAIRRAALAAGLLIGLLGGCGTQSQGPPGSVGRLFSPRSVWNRRLPENAPLDPASGEMVGWLLGQVRSEFAHGPTPNIETLEDSTPIYTVPRKEPSVPVKLLAPVPWARSLAVALRAVPIPPGARPSRGPDGQITIWQPSTNRLWELWEARHTAQGWVAKWGGAIEHVSSSPGYYSASSWPGAASYWGASASSLPLAAGTMRIGELERHRIDHALAIALPWTRAGAYAWPAQRTDGLDQDPASIPEGAHLRIDPRLNVRAMHLPPVVQTMALAAQRYGLIVRDQTGGEAVAFYAEVPTSAKDPYPRIFGGVAPYDLLKYFPWRHLEVLRMSLRRGSGSP